MNRVVTGLSVAALLFASCFIGRSAKGAIQDGDLVTVSRSNHSNTESGAYSEDYTYGGALRGGEFLITGPVGSGVNDGQEVFKTFCLEYAENIALDKPYVATIEGGAICGGYGGATANYDPISGATQWFYQAYRSSTLVTFIPEFKYGNDHWADALQLVFWRLEGELRTGKGNNWAWAYAPNNTYVSNYADKLWEYYESHRAGPDGLDCYQDLNVQVLNLWTTSILDEPLFSDNYAKLDSDGEFRASLTPYAVQSQLYYNEPIPPEGGESPVAPEPASLIAWGSLTCLGFFAARWRRLATPAA